MDIWFTSDTHFGHSNIIKYCRPEFDNVEQMDDCLITNWNEVVKPGDRVFHLGDFSWTLKRAIEVRPLLNGTIRLIAGNHDDIIGLVKAGLFQRVSIWRQFRDLGIIATHVPITVESIRDACVNVHGHVHRNTKDNTDAYRNICVEVTDYRPVSIDSLTTHPQGE